MQAVAVGFIIGVVQDSVDPRVVIDPDILDLDSDGREHVRVVERDDGSARVFVERDVADDRGLDRLRRFGGAVEGITVSDERGHRDDRQRDQRAERERFVRLTRVDEVVNSR